MAIQLLKMQCQHCHAQEAYKMGHEEAETSIEKATDCFQGKTQIQIRSIIRKHTINSAKYGFSVFTCPECQTLFNPYSVEIEYDDIMLFKPFHKCGECNTTLIQVDDLTKSYTCQKCQQVQLVKQ
ncbi:MAG: hypothetical protein KAI02_01800 [Gammaproteobacteria bacterium]|nr:hypothetical protein [Gammaproteobacteria bacterium]